MSSESAPQATQIPLEDAEQAAASFGSLRPGNPVLRSALRLLRGERIESIQPLHNTLKDPNPKRWRERIAAAWTLGRAPLGPEESDAAAGILMNVLENEFRERSLTKLVRWTVRTALSAFLISYLGVMTLYGVAEPHWLDELAVVFSVIGIGALPLALPLQSIFEKGRNDRVRAAAARALGHRGHVESVGPLSGCLFDSSLLVRQASAESLHDLLPRLRDEDFGILGADSVSKLGRALTDSDGSLVVKSLDALEKVGTSHAIPHVERLLKDTRSTLTRDRAQRVLDVLISRKRREAEGKDLLRAVVTPPDPTLSSAPPKAPPNPRSSSSFGPLATTSIELAIAESGLRDQA